MSGGFQRMARRMRTRLAYSRVPRHPVAHQDRKVSDPWPLGVPRSRPVRRRMAGLRRPGS